MNFLHPGLLFGLFGVAIPVIVHLLGRRKGVRVEFAAMDFLLASEKRLAARRRLRDLLLLLSRVLLLVLAVLLLARPLLRGSRPSGAGMPVSAVLVLDQSASMAAQAFGETAFERARSQLLEVLAALPAGSEVAVLGMARAPRRLTPGFATPAEAERALRAAEVGTTAARAEPALAEAVTLLASGHRVARALWIASDLQAHAWSDPALARIDRAGLALTVLDAAPRGFEPNVGLIAAASRVAAGPAADGGEGAGLALEARRSGAAGGGAPEESLVLLEAEGRALNRGLFRFGAEPVARAVLALPGDAPAGVEVSAVLERGGSLGIDDRRTLWLEPSARLRVYLADGAPDTNLYKDEVFYLERALAAEPQRFATRLGDASQGRLGALADSDVVILANVEQLEAADQAALTAFVAAGGGLLLTAGDRVVPDALERELGALLPARPRAIIAARPGEPPIGIAAPRAPVHVVALPFDERAAIAVLEGTQLLRWLTLEPRPDSEVVLSLSNGMPLLVLGEHGKGRVAMLATSADRDWSTLPVRPPYVPLLTRLALWLGDRLERPRPHLFVAGEAMRIEPADARALALAEPPEFDAPDGARVRAAPVPGGGYVIDAVLTPGAWRALVAGKRYPELDFAVNADAVESELERADPAQLRGWLGASALAAAGAPGAQSESRIALPLLALAAVAFLAEAALGSRAARAAASGPDPA